jgi:hypothetical protein
MDLPKDAKIKYEPKEDSESSSEPHPIDCWGSGPLKEEKKI